MSKKIIDYVKYALFVLLLIIIIDILILFMTHGLPTKGGILY